jgi:hypothetical protein
MTAHFTSGFLHTWKWIPSRFNMSWNVLLKNSLHLPVCTQTGHLCTGLEVLRRMYFGSLRVDWNADVTVGPVIHLSGNTYMYLENKSTTVNRYFNLSFYLLRASTSTRSHSQTTVALFTLYRLRGKFCESGNANLCILCVYVWIYDPSLTVHHNPSHCCRNPASTPWALFFWGKSFEITSLNGSESYVDVATEFMPF